MLGSIIIGVGSKSSQFTDKFIKEIVEGKIAGGPKSHGIIAVGVYTGPQGDKLRRAIHKKIGQLGAMDISIDPTINPSVADRVLDDLVELQRKVARLEPESVLLVVDAALINMNQYAEVFHLLRATLQQRGKMAALCFIDDPDHDLSALTTLKSYTANSPTTNNNPILDAVFVVRITGSPLFHASGGANPQLNLLAKSMAQIWEANLYYNFNPTFDDQVHLARQSGHAFIGLAIGSVGLSGQQKQGFLGRLSKPKINGSEAHDALVQLAEDLIQNRPEPRTSIQPLNLNAVARTQSITVNAIAPFSTSDPRFDEVRDGMQKTLRARGYKIAHTSMIPGNGASVSVKSGPQETTYGSAATPHSYPMGEDPGGSSGYGWEADPTVMREQPVRDNPTPYARQNAATDSAIGQVCILFGIEPEQI